MYNYDNDSEIYIQTSGNKNGNGSIIIYPGSRIALEYEKDRTTLSGSDKATIKFTLKNEVPSTSGSRARAIRAMYIGVNGVARKIKKAYIGINGVARCFWAIPKIEKVNTSIQSLTPRHDFMSGSLGNYAIYAGGGVLPENPNNYPRYYSTNIVEYYDNSLSKKTASSLSFSVGNGKM
ncbi:MAG: hypothetical protein IKY94_15915 [Lachnospiraceae bacterium]|nr:hypothetical protein [Lachnospiraceae bacterium]